MELTAGADDGWVATQMAFRGASTPPPYPCSPTILAISSAPQTLNESSSRAPAVIESHGPSQGLTTATGLS